VCAYPCVGAQHPVLLGRSKAAHGQLGDEDAALYKGEQPDGPLAVRAALARPQRVPVAPQVARVQEEPADLAHVLPPCAPPGRSLPLRRVDLHGQLQVELGEHAGVDGTRGLVVVLRLLVVVFLDPDDIVVRINHDHVAVVGIVLARPCHAVAAAAAAAAVNVAAEAQVDVVLVVDKG